MPGKKATPSRNMPRSRSRRGEPQRAPENRPDCKPRQRRPRCGTGDAEPDAAVSDELRPDKSSAEAISSDFVVQGSIFVGDDLDCEVYVGEDDSGGAEGRALAQPVRKPVRLTADNLRAEQKGKVGRILPIGAYAFQARLRFRRRTRHKFWPRTIDGRTKRARAPDLERLQEHVRVLAVDIYKDTGGRVPAPGSELERAVGVEKVTQFLQLKQRLAFVVEQKIASDPSSVPIGIPYSTHVGELACTFVPTWALLLWHRDHGWPLMPLEVVGFIDFYNAQAGTADAARDILIAALYHFGRSYPGYGPLCRIGTEAMTGVLLQARTGLSRQNLRSILNRYTRRREYPLRTP
jgi:hypothetical protein